MNQLKEARRERFSLTHFASEASQDRDPPVLEPRVFD
jgi:hypothetical protein